MTQEMNSTHLKQGEASAFGKPALILFVAAFSAFLATFVTAEI